MCTNNIFADIRVNRLKRQKGVFRWHEISNYRNYGKSSSIFELSPWFWFQDFTCQIISCVQLLYHYTVNVLSLLIFFALFFFHKFIASFLYHSFSLVIAFPPISIEIVVTLLTLIALKSDKDCCLNSWINSLIIKSKVCRIKVGI